ncbi:DUF4350 domain-containing protein [Paludifilum halophilum]|uniref:DUF4350 domain-containing protein n=1 Tax=Paludifilum halophilum TaxID=1642702 RepID=UPI00146EEC4B|nr:DUF4350 domain-containing protein [Paludifilum halophilum]
MKITRGVLVLLISVIVIGLLGWLVAFLPASYPSYSSESPAQDGVKGVYRLFKERGVEVARWENHWGDLPDDQGHVLFIVAPEQFLIPETARDRLLRWVSRGNVVVLWADPADPMVTELGFIGESGDGKEKRARMEPVAAGWLKDVRSLYFPRDFRLSDYVELDDSWKDTDGIRRMGRLNTGKGSIYYIPDPEMITNRYIEQADNLALPLYFASLADTKVWFDEGVHKGALSVSGNREEDTPSSPWQLLSGEAWLLIFQGTGLFLLWLFWRGKRFAAPRQETVTEVRTSDEYIEAMGGLYQWAGLGRESLSIQLDGLLKEAAKHFGLPGNASRMDTIRWTRRFLGDEKARRLERLIEEVEQAPSKVKGRKLIRLSREIQEMREEIAEWKTAPSTQIT